MQPKVKKTIVITVLVIAAVCVFLFAPFGTLQIGNNVISGNYYDTPLEAYNNGDAAFNLKEEIATIDLTDKAAIWLVYTDDDCIAVEGMSVKDGKYFDIQDTSLFDCHRNDIPTSEIDFSDVNAEFALITEDNYDDYTGNPYYTKEEFSYTDINGNNAKFMFLYHISDN